MEGADFNARMQAASEVDDFETYYSSPSRMRP
jgi:hypothetical protein